MGSDVRFHPPHSDPETHRRGAPAVGGLGLSGSHLYDSWPLFQKKGQNGQGKVLKNPVSRARLFIYWVRAGCKPPASGAGLGSPLPRRPDTSVSVVRPGSKPRSQPCSEGRM